MDGSTPTPSGPLKPVRVAVTALVVPSITDTVPSLALVT